MSKIRKFFPGGNTGLGFRNMFKGIVPKDENAHTIIIKGGPGVGKSTLMKKVADTAKEADLSVEEFYCSGDPQSLDAVRIVEKNMVILDGTAPHIIDPVLPGIDDETLNLGIYIDCGEMMRYRNRVKRLFEENHYEYILAYSYLSTARLLKKTCIDYYDERFEKNRCEEYIDTLLKKSGKNIKIPVRELFISAITCKGFVDFYEDIEGNEVFLVEGKCSECFMNILAKKSERFERELFYDPLLADVLCAVHLKESNTWFVTDNGKGKINASKHILTDEFYSGDTPEFIEFNMAQTNILEEKAMTGFMVCKELHDEIEGLYKANVNFNGVNEETLRVIAKVLG